MSGPYIVRHGPCVTTDPACYCGTTVGPFDDPSDAWGAIDDPARPFVVWQDGTAVYRSPGLPESCPRCRAAADTAGAIDRLRMGRYYRGGDACPRCGRWFPSAKGYAWHLANRPDCVAVPSRRARPVASIIGGAPA